MKKFAVILLMLSLTRIGVAYADTNASSNSSYFFGTKNASANLNQVLALLVGPKGDPGPAGVAGKDGIIGMNGKDGLPGAPGAAGEKGQDGASILSAAFTGSRGTCNAGGIEFTDGAGTKTYACNGANGLNGADGATGATGATGPAGSGGGSGGGSLGYGQGEVSVGACEADNKIVILPTRTFTGTDFVFSGFNLGDPTVTDGDIHNTCATKTVNIYLKIKASGLTNTSGHYIANDIVKCSFTLPASGSWVNTKWQFTMNTGNTACATIRTPGTAVALDEISTADYTDKIGFEIG